MKATILSPIMLIAVATVGMSEQKRISAFALDADTGETLDSVMIVYCSLSMDMRTDTAWLYQFQHSLGLPLIKEGFVQRASLFVPQGDYEVRVVHPQYYTLIDTLHTDEERVYFEMMRNPDASLPTFTALRGNILDAQGEPIDSARVVTTGIDHPFHHVDYQIDWSKYGDIKPLKLPEFTSVVFVPGTYRIEVSAKGYNTHVDTVTVGSGGQFIKITLEK